LPCCLVLCSYGLLKQQSSKTTHSIPTLDWLQFFTQDHRNNRYSQDGLQLFTQDHRNGQLLP
jgi:hypothetical protein